MGALAEKRCVNYGTCGTAPQFKDRTKDDVTPRANMGITASFEKGRAAIFYGQVGVAKRMISQINKDLTISRIQGVMRYAYRMGRPENKSKRTRRLPKVQRLRWVRCHKFTRVTRVRQQLLLRICRLGENIPLKLTANSSILRMFVPPSNVTTHVWVSASRTLVL